MRELLDQVHAFGARRWDAERGLLTTPAGRHDDRTVAAGELGLLPPTLWWAHGLLVRGGDDDGARAHAAIEAVVALQHDAPGRPWHGTWPAVAEEPPPGPDAVAYEDYDPNWRAFVGASLALLVRDHALPASLAERVRAAVVRAVRAEPADRVHASYTNVAVLLAWLELEVAGWEGDEELAARGGARVRAIAGDTAARGHVAEHLSPTYTGITLWGLSLWAERAPVPELAGLGAALRDQVWQALLAAWHPELRTLGPPFTRAYGMDLREHVGATGPWLAWLVDGPDPLPPLDAAQLHQGHDLPMVFLVDALADAGEDVRELAVRVRARPARHGAWTDRVGDRAWSGWAGDALVVGAEDSPVDWGGWWQLVTAAALWSAPDGRTSWLRLHQDAGAVGARVTTTATSVTLEHDVPDASLRLLVGGPGPTTVDTDHVAHGGRRWRLEGVTAVARAADAIAPDARAAWVLTAGPGPVRLTTDTEG